MRFFFPIVFLCLACLNEPDCLVTATDMAIFSFKKNDKKRTADTLWIDSVRASGYAKLFIANKEDPTKRNITGLKLPLNPEASQTTYSFYYRKKPTAEQQVAVITFSYFKNIQIISKKCGAFSFYENLSVVKTTTPSVRVVQPQLFTTVTLNAEITF